MVSNYHSYITCNFFLSFLFVPNRVRKLDLGCNDLFELPQDINKMTGLEELNLHDNLLESLPENICKMPKLAKLDVSDNKIKIFPLKMDELAKRIEVHKLHILCLSCQFSGRLTLDFHKFRSRYSRSRWTSWLSGF